LATNPIPDVAVVGAGVIGCSIARELALQGASVLVLDRASVAAESSSAAAGILAPRVHATEPGMFPLALASHALFEPLAEALIAETGQEFGFARSDVLDLALDEADDERLHDKLRWLQDAGHAVRWLDARETLEHDPALIPTVRGAFFDEDAYQIHPGRFTQALASGATRAGVRFQLGAEVIGLASEGTRASHVRTTAGDLAAGHIVLATGAWMRASAEWLGMCVEVFPAKGQILSVASVDTPLRSIIYGGGIYLLPRTDGTIVVGATVEQAGFDKSLTADALAWLLGTIPAVCPELREARFQHAWSGLRPGSPDGLPIVGAAPGWDNVTIAGGHFRNGIMLAPITARLATDLILKGRRDPLLAPLDPARFA